MESALALRESPQNRLLKGMLAGLVAGLVATAAKTMAERFYPANVPQEHDRGEAFAEQVAGHPLATGTREAAGEAIHWGFGALTGAAYGALAEFYPAATAKEGASFGLALMALTHEGALPAMGLAADPNDQPLTEKASEASSHVLYGVVAERVRSMVRKLL